VCCAFVRLAENYKGKRVDCSKAVRDTAGMRVIDFYCLSTPRYLLPVRDVLLIGHLLALFRLQRSLSARFSPSCTAMHMDRLRHRMIVSAEVGECSRRAGSPRSHWSRSRSRC